MNEIYKNNADFSGKTEKDFGRVFDIKELTVHDGEGVRLTVFMKGCPLRCKWCHNPEGLSFEKQLLYKKAKCVKCGACLKPCNHKECAGFPRCVKVCPNNCLSVCGKDYTPEELAAIINGYAPVFKALGGGVTFSGGEPLMQWEFLSRTIKLLNGINTAVETAGYVGENVFKSAINALDYIIMDIKIFDSEKHEKYTGVKNDLIKANFLTLKNSGKPYLIRTPLIEGITDDNENLTAIKNFIGDSPWEKLPENKLAKAKYDMLTLN